MNDDWRTPPYLFNWLDATYHFNVDLAASHVNHLLPDYITKETNALATPWHSMGRAGFCNPPYSDIDPWVRKAIRETERRFTTVMLIPCPNGEDRYRLVERYASNVVLIHGRIAFLDEEGKPVSGNRAGSCVVVFKQGARPGGAVSVGWADRDALMRRYS